MTGDALRHAGACAASSPKSHVPCQTGDITRRSIDNEGAYDFVEVKGERVDSVVQEDVLLMKLDVEGFEPTAFQSSKGILDSYKCAAHLFWFVEDM